MPTIANVPILWAVVNHKIIVGGRFFATNHSYHHLFMDAGKNSAAA